MLKELISKIINLEDLELSEARSAMGEIMSGKATDAQIAAFITALRMKGESIDEITGFAEVMREKATRIEPNVKGNLVDVCGTGGAKLKTFNISTISAFVVAGANVAVAKHGNRSFTSKCGSADLVEGLGVNLEADPKETEGIIEDIGIGFLFAPKFHKAMQFVAKPRKEIGIRTVFNILGPLTNPAGAKAQIVGVFDSALVKKLPPVLKNLGLERALVVHGIGGIDEISNIGKTLVGELKSSRISYYKISPDKFNLKLTNLDKIKAEDIAQSVKLAKGILRNEIKDEKLEVVLLNSAAGIYLGGKCNNLQEGIEIAKESLESGRAYDKLKALVKATRGDLSKLE